jgi:hypothetical protein
MHAQQAKFAEAAGRDGGEVVFSAPSAWRLLSGRARSKIIPFATLFFKI